MDAYVITIAREYASGGREIGQMLSKKLGIGFYDKYIIRLASEDSGIHEEAFGRVDEYTSAKTPRFGKTGVYSGTLLPPQSPDFMSDENLFSYQAKIIRELAEKEDCVIIGRCSNFILDIRHYPRVLRVFVHASSFEHRVEAAKKMMSKSEKEIIEFLRKDDERKRDFCRRYIGKEWTEPENYDLVLDTSKIGIEKAMEEIEEAYLRLKRKA